MAKNENQAVWIFAWRSMDGFGCFDIVSNFRKKCLQMIKMKNIIFQSY